jgi:hypothetical protein
LKRRKFKTIQSVDWKRSLSSHLFFISEKKKLLTILNEPLAFILFFLSCYDSEDPSASPSPYLSFSFSSQNANAAAGHGRGAASTRFGPFSPQARSSLRTDGLERRCWAESCRRNRWCWRHLEGKAEKKKKDAKNSSSHMILSFTAYLLQILLPWLSRAEGWESIHVDFFVTVHHRWFIWQGSTYSLNPLWLLAYRSSSIVLTLLKFWGEHSAVRWAELVPCLLCNLNH